LIDYKVSYRDLSMCLTTVTWLRWFLSVDSRVVSGELLKRGQLWVIDYVGILTFNKISVIGVKNNILKSENSKEKWMYDVYKLSAKAHMH